MKVKTLQDYQDKDYSLTREERLKLVVIPVEHLKGMLKALKFQSNWESSRITEARLKRKAVNREIAKMEQECFLVDDLLDHYLDIDEVLIEEEIQDEDDG